MDTKITNMTQGHPLKLLLFFSLPLMLGNVFQQFYTIVDTMIVGKGVGVHALAALGSADWFNWMILGIITGISQGFSILIAQFFGANDENNLRKSMAIAMKLAFMIGCILMIVAFILSEPVLNLLNTPLDILPLSLIYLRIMFLGSLIVMAYNVLASFLRALGDSKTPLQAMIIACIINIVLDFVFVMILHWGVAGAAFATVIAQGFSAFYCFIVMKRLTIFHFTKDDFKLDYQLSFKMLKLGSLMAFQNTIIAIGGMMLQSIVNSFGILYVAGYTASNKLYGLLELAATSFGFALSTYCGQNLGAKDYKRIQLGMKSALLLAICTSIIISLFIISFGKIFLSWFVSGTPSEIEHVLSVAYTYLFIMAICLPVLYLLHIYRSALQGMGDTFIPMLSGLGELMMRVSMALLLPRFIGANGIFVAEVLAWVGAVIVLIPSYYHKVTSLLKQNEFYF